MNYFSLLPADARMKIFVCLKSQYHWKMRHFLLFGRTCKLVHADVWRYISLLPNRLQIPSSQVNILLETLRGVDMVESFRSLAVTNPDSWQSLSALTSLRVLSLFWKTAESFRELMMSPPLQFQLLTHLDIHIPRSESYKRAGCFNCNVISLLTRLESLALDCHSLFNPSESDVLKRLRVLRLSMGSVSIVDVGKPSDLNFLTSCSSLQELYLSLAHLPASLLPYLTNLRSIHSICPDELGRITTLQRLTSLHIDDDYLYSSFDSPQSVFPEKLPGLSLLTALEVGATSSLVSKE